MGSRTIGVAVSDELHWTAQGIGTIRRTNLEKDLKALSDVVTRYRVGEIVVGLPRNMNSSLGGQAEKVLKFIDKLKKYFSLPVQTWDERLTTVAADRVLEEAAVHRRHRKKMVDQIAAALILQSYLDFKMTRNASSAKSSGGGELEDRRPMGNKEVIGMAICPECEAEIDVFDVEKGEIVDCPECGIELEVINDAPIELDIAPEEEEDWVE